MIVLPNEDRNRSNPCRYKTLLGGRQLACEIMVYSPWWACYEFAGSGLLTDYDGSIFCAQESRETQHERQGGLMLSQQNETR